MGKSVQNAAESWPFQQKYLRCQKSLPFDILGTKIIARRCQASKKLGRRLEKEAVKDKSKRKQLIDAIADEGRKMSTQTVLFHTAVADRLGLNPSDHKCGDLIISHPEPMTAGRLAEVTGLSTGAITGVIDRLERAGFVERAYDPNDRRRVVVRPTPERMPDLHRFFVPLRDAMQAACEKYTNQELELLIDFMQRCRAVSEQQVQRLKQEPRVPARPLKPRQRARRAARPAP